MFLLLMLSLHSLASWDFDMHHQGFLLRVFFFFSFHVIQPKFMFLLRDQWRKLGNMHEQVMYV